MVTPTYDPARRATHASLYGTPDGGPGPLDVRPAASPQPPHALHFVLQHQGRTGGSLVAALLAQYHARYHEPRGVPTLGFDLAPLTPGFARYGRAGALGVRRVVRQDRDGRWSFDHAMDELVEVVYRAVTRRAAAARQTVLTVATAVQPGVPATAVTAIADVGPAAFLAFFECVADGAVGDALAGVGVRVVLHAVTASGEAISPAVAACYARAVALPADTAAVIWRNDGPAHGIGGPNGPTAAPATHAARSERALHVLVAALAERYRVAGVVHVPALPGLGAEERDVPETASHDIEHGPVTDALVDALPFAEALRAPWPDSPARHRLRAARDGVFAQLARALGATDLAT
ncbi:MAG TPA: hypothetical protein VGD56_13600 [Gemmatirosa sp.]